MVKNTKHMYTPKPVLLTPEGIKKLELELAERLEERKDAVMHVAKAREMGDLSENGYYKSYKAKLGFLDSRLRRINHMLRFAKVIEKPHSDIVQIGSHVALVTREKHVSYTIVGKQEANPAEGRISDVSPLGKILLGKKVGDRVEISGAAKTVQYTVRSVT